MTELSQNIINHLVIYGTLAPGEVNHHQLSGLKGIWTKAIVRGHLADLGWGAKAGFPGLRPDPNGPKLSVHLFSSDELVDYWDHLDAFEGTDYRRELINVETDQAMVQAWIYVLA